MTGQPPSILPSIPEFYASLVQSADDAIVAKDTDGIVIGWNAAAERLFGYSAEEMVGQSIRILLPADRQHEEDDILARIRQGEVVGQFLTKRLHKDGHLLDIAVTVSPVRDGEGRILGASKIARDAGPRLENMRRIREADLRFRMLADNISQLAWMADPDGMIFWYNQRWYDYSGTDFETMQGFGWQAVHHPDHVDRVTAGYREALAAKEHWEDTFPLRGKDGQYRWYLSHALPVRGEDGEVLYWFGTNTDITEQREQAEQIRTLLMEVNHRSKNMLAIVQALARRTAPDDAGFVARFEERVRSLAVNQDILVRREWRDVPVPELVQQQLRFAEAARGGLMLDGPVVHLTPRAADPDPPSHAVARPTELTIPQAAAALRAGSLTAAALTEAHLARIADRDPQIRAFVHLAPDLARAAAARADADFAAGVDRGLLQGIPFAVKDLIDVAGLRVTSGSRRHATRTATGTAPAVRRILDSGGVPLGMVATYDLALVGPSTDAPYPPARNPWNLAQITGGSSSGSAAAVAAGLVRVALGTDTGGSIRAPAAYCGVVGLKPTYGTVPMDGVQPLAPGLDHLGPLARTVAEAAIVHAVLTGTAVPEDSGAPLRIGYARDWALSPEAAPGLIDLLDAAISALTLEGAEVAHRGLPDIAWAEAAGAVLIHAEALATHDADLADPRMGRMALQSLIAGVALTAEDVVRARAAADAARVAVDRALHGVDVLVTATTLTPAPPVAAFADGRAVWTPMRTLPFNATGHPAVSVPMGFLDGLPVGLQIVGRHGDEAAVLRAAAVFEAATDHAVHRPPV